MTVQEVWAVRTGTLAVTPDSHCHSFAIPKCSLALRTLTAEDTIKWSYMFTLPVVACGLSGMAKGFLLKTFSLSGSSHCIS